MPDNLIPSDQLPVSSEKPYLFQKGKSGNPLGRKKKEIYLSELTRNLLKSKRIDVKYTYPKNGKLYSGKMFLESDRTLNDTLIFTLIKQGMDGDVSAIKEVFDRAYGKAPQAIEHSGRMEIETPKYDFSELTIEQQRAIRDAFRIAENKQS